MTFLMENLSTVIIGLILAGVVYLVVRKMIRDRREGKGCGCSGGCAGCSGASMCHGGQRAGREKQVCLRKCPFSDHVLYVKIKG